MPIDPLKTQADAQKSEAHGATEDASTSPAAHPATPPGGSAASPPSAKLDPDPPSDVQVIRDDTDAGGPLVIQSTDPDLNPPQVPIDPFPTEGKPEIDPPVQR